WIARGQNDDKTAAAFEHRSNRERHRPRPSARAYLREREMARPAEYDFGARQRFPACRGEAAEAILADADQP
ncbi:MAG: hypothetical protein JWR79_673, partial [Tardiphaga sp.]|nr:hypothetical protein [Tardiphaga sp.]